MYVYIYIIYIYICTTRDEVMDESDGGNDEARDDNHSNMIMTQTDPETEALDVMMMIVMDS